MVHANDENVKPVFSHSRRSCELAAEFNVANTAILYKWCAVGTKNVAVRSAPAANVGSVAESDSNITRAESPGAVCKKNVYRPLIVGRTKPFHFTAN